MKKNKVVDREGNVLLVNFSPPSMKHTIQGCGVFIKPPRTELASYILAGNIGGLYPSDIVFDEKFSPSLFGRQVREELGINLVGHEDLPPPPEVA